MAVDVDGQTPLHFAVACEFEDVVTMLVLSSDVLLPVAHVYLILAPSHCSLPLERTKTKKITTATRR